MSLTYFNGKTARTLSTKALGIGDLDRFMEWAVSQGSSELNKDALYQAVAFVYRGVQLRAQTLSALPFEIMRGDKIVDTSDDYQNVLGWLPDPVRVLSLLEQSLCVAGYSYWFIERNRVKVLSLNYWNPYTITPDIKPSGLQGFERSVNGKVVPFDVEDVFYVWPADYRVELGPPKGSPVAAAFKAAGVLDSTDEFVKAFFERGGIKNLLVSAKGMGRESDRKNLAEWFKSLFRGGNKTAFNTAVVNAETITTVPIGEGIDNLDNNALTMERRESVVAALGVPMSMILSSTIAGMGGGGVATQDDINFAKKTIEPEARYIAGVLNDQLFQPYGDYQIRFNFEKLDIYKVDEQKRALSFATYVQSDMKPEVAAYMLGLEIPKDEEIPPWYVNAFKEKMPIPAAFGGPPDDDEDEPEKDVVAEAQQAEIAKEKEELEKSVNVEIATDSERNKQIDMELGKWRKKAQNRVLEGKPEKAQEFVSEYLDDATINAVKYALGMCITAADVDDAFNHVMGKGVRFIPRGADLPLPTVDTIIDEDDVERAVKAWDTKMPDFAGMLDAEVVNKTNFESENA